MRGSDGSRPDRAPCAREMVSPEDTPVLATSQFGASRDQIVNMLGNTSAIHNTAS